MRQLYKPIVWFYGVSLLIVASLRFIPWINDPQGNLFGVFHLDWLDDILHTGTGVWALVAVSQSRRWSEIYLIGIGALYFSDAVIGLIYGQNPLHIGFWTGEPLYLTFLSRVLINGPHFFLGGFALLFGLHLRRQTFKNRV